MLTHMKIITAVGLMSIAGSVFAVPTPIDLNTFQQEGPLGNGNWVVSGDGNSVLQTINGNPTAFVSPGNFFNTQFQGSFSAANDGDDDYMGFVFGFDANDTTPFFLFDWKQGQQSGSAPGFYLSEVSGGLNAIPFGNHHLDATGYDVLATNLGTGWVDNVIYDFTLEYTASLIKIDISGGSFGTGTNIFNYATSGNTTGRFGFYNFSQSQVAYQGFTETVAPTFCELNPTDPQCTGAQVPVPVPLSLIGLGLGLLGLSRRIKR
ncbi:MAG: hypothetical protein FHK78_02655 [Sedimenticola selenatireducens]|uniref:TSP C-terminal domain-containing protein n=2 Tax=Sedimenticola selenatireducens TaxID=191960 RepID=A0A558DYW9_9GAMM|nr:hypothetical protein FHP88_14220 [Sedimenticola selenatireducens]TVT66160.1 MAG: hypothetical protein FHK78_02655 [Sedimenticola selenatireducens]